MMLERVKRILSEYTEVDMGQVTRESELIADVELNSLDVMNVVVDFEEEFGIEIPDRVIGTFYTVGDLVEYLERGGTYDVNEG